MRIAILAYSYCTSSMIWGVLDILSFANMQGKSSGKKKSNTLFEVDIVTTDGKAVHSFNHHPIMATKSIASKTVYDLIYVPGFLGDLQQVLDNQRKNIAWLKKQYAQGTKLAAACNGNFILAETGLLKKKKATTHWSLINEFRSRYPDAQLQPEKILIDEGDIISGAGTTACLNLALYLVHRFGSAELAMISSKVFLVDSGRRIQKPYETYTVPKQHGDEIIVKTQEWVEKNFKEPVTLEGMTEVSHLGKRTLIRRFKKATGDTPLVYLQKLRIENAKRLLEGTGNTFNEITWQVGYEDVSSFQRLFKSQTGLSPKEYRSKFSLL
jgi:transcriptional regulator GlxA family with amidase domain